MIAHTAAARAGEPAPGKRAAARKTAPVPGEFNINAQNLPGMRQLLRQYKSRTGWQGCWRMDGCLAFEDMMRRMRNRTLPKGDALAYLAGRAPWLM